MAIWITSDLHFCHNREFLYKSRGFSNVDEMNESIIKNWNTVINWNDNVYVLGDMMLNDDVHGLSCIKQLNGNIHIILGNHDTLKRVGKYEDCYNVHFIEYATLINYKGLHFYLSHYPTITSNWDFDKPLKSRVINLCGHIHTKDRFADWDKGLIYHCELDAHNNFPVNLDTVVDDIRVRYEKEGK